MGPIALCCLAAAAVAAVAASAAGRDSASPTASRCGGQLWRLKTLSDPQRSMVQLAAKGTTIEALGQRPFPRPVPRRRRTSFQRQAWKVVAQITRYRIDSGGVRLELFDHGSYANAVIPALDCLSQTTRARAQLAAVWKEFTNDCGHPRPDWQPLGATVYVDGVGFWSQRRGLRGAARNGAELHPVTGFLIVAGC